MIASSILLAALMAALIASKGLESPPTASSPTTTSSTAASTDHQPFERASRSELRLMVRSPATSTTTVAKARDKPAVVPQAKRAPTPTTVAVTRDKRTTATSIARPSATTTTTDAVVHAAAVPDSGFVADGGPQPDDAHCVGTTLQRVSCLVARRPECRHRTMAMDRATAARCWQPEIDVYPWPHAQMFDALYCESKGEEGAVNGRYRGLLQDDGAIGDAAHDFEHAFRVKWLGQGKSAWAATYGRHC